MVYPVPDDQLDFVRRTIDKLVLESDGHFRGLQDIAYELKELFKKFTTDLWRYEHGAAALEHWWFLGRTGVIALPGVGMSETGLGPQIVLSARGKRLLEDDGDRSPHDPKRFLAALRRRVPQPDEIALGYVEEAIRCWAADASRIAKSLAQPVSRVSALYDDVHDGLLASNPSGEIADAIERRLTAIFDHARILRNKSGHPTGEEIGREEAEAGLMMFPRFHSFVSDVNAHLATLAQ